MPRRWYGDVEGLTTDRCSGLCAPGYYCEPGSTTPTQHECGEGAVARANSGSGILVDVVYCPRGSSGPVSVSPGYYATGGLEGTRTGQTKCDVDNEFHDLCPDATMTS